jgi:hypothetical protein
VGLSAVPQRRRRRRKSQFGKMFKGLAMEEVGILYGHFGIPFGIFYGCMGVFFPVLVCCTKKNLATRVVVHIH